MSEIEKKSVKKSIVSNWKIKIKIEGKETEPIEMRDAKEILGEYISIRRNYFDELIKSLETKRYNIGKGIEEIIGIDGENWTKNPWLLLLAKDNESNAPMWFLIDRKEISNGFLVALGPDIFSKYLKNSKEDIEEVRKLLEYMVSNPRKWKMTVLIPNFLS